MCRTIATNKRLQNPKHTFRVGDRISVVAWGEYRQGSVTRLGPIKDTIWVELDNSPIDREMFFHPKSLSHVREVLP